jgi:hypothetical protein
MASILGRLRRAAGPDADVAGVCDLAQRNVPARRSIVATYNARAPASEGELRRLLRCSKLALTKSAWDLDLDQAALAAFCPASHPEWLFRCDVSWRGWSQCPAPTTRIFLPDQDIPTIVNLRWDPFERTPSIHGETLNNSGGGYVNDFMAREFWRFVQVREKVADLARTAIEFPPMQAPASFNLSAVKEKIDAAMRTHEGQ